MLFNKKGMSGCNWLILLVVLAGGAWWALPKYFGQLERTNALSMQAMLVEATIAEEKVFFKQKKYTSQWKELVPHMQLSPTLQVEIKPLANESDYFFGFYPKAAQQENGYRVSVQLAADKKSGVVKAQRTGSHLYAYELERSFPDGKTHCLATRGKALCKQVEQAIEELELVNLEPVSAEQANSEK